MVEKPCWDFLGGRWFHQQYQKSSFIGWLILSSCYRPRTDQHWIALNLHSRVYLGHPWEYVQLKNTSHVCCFHWHLCSWSRVPRIAPLRRRRSPALHSRVAPHRSVWLVKPLVPWTPKQLGFVGVIGFIPQGPIIVFHVVYRFWSMPISQGIGYPKIAEGDWLWSPKSESQMGLKGPTAPCQYGFARLGFREKSQNHPPNLDAKSR